MCIYAKNNSLCDFSKAFLQTSIVCIFKNALDVYTFMFGCRISNRVQQVVRYDIAQILYKNKSRINLCTSTSLQSSVNVLSLEIIPLVLYGRREMLQSCKEMGKNFIRRGITLSAATDNFYHWPNLWYETKREVAKNSLYQDLSSWKEEIKWKKYVINYWNKYRLPKIIKNVWLTTVWLLN